jgi:RNA polymerase sigma-70 factor (ECF subfamily)
VPTREAVELSDAELLSRSATGDSGAYEAFVTRHEGWLYRYARVLAGGEADDVIQDAFVDAWRGAASFAGGDSARGWLVTVTRHAFYRRHRHRAGEPAIHEPLESVDDLAFAAGWGAPTPADVFEQTMTREAIEAALARLEPAEREVVVLRDLEGFSADEAAALVGVTRAALKSRLHRGRLRLAAYLQEYRHGQS